MDGSVTLLSSAKVALISGEYIKGKSHESWQPGEVCSRDGSSAGLKGD